MTEAGGDSSALGRGRGPQTSEVGKGASWWGIHRQLSLPDQVQTPQVVVGSSRFPHRVNGGFLKRSCVWGWALAGILPGCLPLGSSCPRGPVMVTFLVLYSGGLQGPASDIF